MDERAAVVLDDVALVRLGIATVLRDLGLDVVLETYSPREALAFAAVQPFALAVVGSETASMPAPNGDGGRAGVVERLKALAEPPAVVALVGPGRDDDAVAFVRAGADALLPARVPPDELARAVTGALAGSATVAASLQWALHGAFAPAAGAPRPPGLLPADALSAREQEVVALLAEGRTNREIAETLSVSLATVKTHLVRIYAKLGVRNRAGALHAAVGRGLLR